MTFISVPISVTRDSCAYQFLPLLSRMAKHRTMKISSPGFLTTTAGYCMYCFWSCLVGNSAFFS